VEEDDEEEYIISKNEIERNYNAVKKWTKHVDIFNKKFLVLPYNAPKNHWAIFIICYPKNIFED